MKFRLDFYLDRLGSDQFWKCAEFCRTFLLNETFKGLYHSPNTSKPIHIELPFQSSQGCPIDIRRKNIHIILLINFNSQHFILILGLVETIQYGGPP